MKTQLNNIVTKLDIALKINKLFNADDTVFYYEYDPHNLEYNRVVHYSQCDLQDPTLGHIPTYTAEEVTTHILSEFNITHIEIKRNDEKPVKYEIFAYTPDEKYLRETGNTIIDTLGNLFVLLLTTNNKMKFNIGI